MLAPFGGDDTLSDTPNGDDGNLMYWTIVGAETNLAPTAGQGLILRANPLVGP